jgi:hypothetical protein
MKAMRGSDGMQEALFIVAKLEDFVPADHPLRAMLIQVFFSVRSERELMEQVRYNLLYDLAPLWQNPLRRVLPHCVCRALVAKRSH